MMVREGRSQAVSESIDSYGARIDGSKPLSLIVRPDSRNRPAMVLIEVCRMKGFYGEAFHV